MARICCVESCRALPQEDITFFNFPIKNSLQKKWKDAIRPTETLTVESVICSRHFAEEDYETIRGKVRLKAKVVPTIFEHMDSQNSPKDDENPKQNGHSLSPNADHTVNGEEANNEAEAVNSNCKEANISNEGESGVEGGLEEDGLEDSHEMEYEMPMELSCEVQLTEGEENETIECVPEAILHEDSDSHSEGDIHKEDIEDIIANYHIKQDPKLAERLKASQEKENLSNNQDSNKESVSDKDSNKSVKVINNSGKDINNSGKDINNSGKDCNNSGKDSNNSGKDSRSSGKRASLPPDKDDDDCVEVSFQPSRKRRRPEYIEIPVDKDTDKSNDCLMVMEKVQVDIDPSTLLFSRSDLDDDDDGEVESDDDSDVQETTEVLPKKETDSKRKNDPISLLTSSDEDDVIIEEPHIDTVEVSDETDEDDVPLTQLIKTDEPSEPTTVGKILWGRLYEYYCYKCRHTSTSKAEYIKHKLKHEKVFNVCDICEFSTASKSQFIRHKRKHKENKVFNCHLCDYKAKHHMSLIYHLKSHGVDEKAARDTLDTQRSKCPNCNMYFTHVKNEFAKHYKACKSVTDIKCTKCRYVTSRSSDLKRHVIKKHLRKRKGSDDDDDDDYEP